LETCLVSAKIEDKFPLDIPLVSFGVHKLVEFLCRHVFKDGRGVLSEMCSMFFAEGCAKHGAPSLVETSPSDGYAWGAADNTAMLVNFESLGVFEALPCSFSAYFKVNQPCHLKLCYAKQLKGFCRRKGNSHATHFKEFPICPSQGNYLKISKTKSDTQFLDEKIIPFHAIIEFP